MMHFIFIAAVFAMLTAPTHAQTLTGQASVIDGDTIEIHGQRIRLSTRPSPISFAEGDDSLLTVTARKPQMG